MENPLRCSQTAVKKRGPGRPPGSKNKTNNACVSEESTPSSPAGNVSNPQHPPTTPADICLVCNTTTNTGGDVVQCDRCTLWYHTSCTKDNELPVTSKYNWYCTSCFQSHFPNFTPSRDISSGKWGTLSGHSIKDALETAYDTIIKCSAYHRVQ